MGTPSPSSGPRPEGTSWPAPLVEIRLHGRGGQGGVTCAKIIAAIYAGLGQDVQTFGDYAGERSGAPVRAYTRVAGGAITNRNKVYRPDHVLILDPSLLGDDSTAGLAPGGTLLVNSPLAPAELGPAYAAWRVATVDATGIARRHKIGTRSVVIVNTTIVGAFVRALGLPLEALESTYRRLGFASNLPSAREAYESVRVQEPSGGAVPAPAAPAPRPAVLPLVDHVESAAPGLKTGNWRSQTPRYATHLAPCSAFCPAGNDVVGFVQALVRSGVGAASSILGRTTPLAAVCGRVCPAPCMEGCNRRESDGSVNIRGLERWVADHVPVADRPGPARYDGRRIAVVGGGPAGLSAAYELARAGHQVTILEGEPALGGVLRTGIPSYRLPSEVLDREIAAILALGVEARCGTFLDRAALARLPKKWDGVIFATGLQRLRGVEVPGADLPGVEQGIRFLHRVNLEAGVRMDGHVVVLGGGNTAMDCARSALRTGASRVTIAYRRTLEEMPAIREEIEEAREEGVEFLFLRAPVGFAGRDRVEAVELAEVELGPPDATGRRSPVTTSRRGSLAADHVLLALGQSADLSLLPEGWELREGRIFDRGRALNVVAAGDVATGDGTVTHAIGDGRRAAGRLLRMLGLEAEVFERPDRASAVPATDIRVDHFARSAPARERVAPPARRRGSFDEVSRGLADPLEAHRCYSCGDCTKCDTCLVYCPEGIIHREGDGYAIDYAYCKGCGLCVAECPRKAMEMSSS